MFVGISITGEVVVVFVRLFRAGCAVCRCLAVDTGWWVGLKAIGIAYLFY